MKIKVSIIKVIMIAVVIIASSNAQAQNVGINSTGAAPDASAGLDVAFSNKGVLIPRVTLTGLKDVSTISSAINSLMIYNTATAGSQPYTVYPGFYYWQDSLWTRVNDKSGTIILTADRVNNNGTANTIADVTGLSFPVASGITYHFKFFIVYTSAATTTGSRWCINGPTNTNLNYRSTYSLTSTTRTFNEGLSTYNVPAASNGSSATTGSNIAEIEGIITPNANGTVIARFASEILSSAITAKANLSYVQWEVVK